MSVLSEHTLMPEGTLGELVALDVQDFPIQRRWYVVYLAGKQLSVIAEAFLKYLLEHAQSRSIWEGSMAANGKIALSR